MKRATFTAAELSRAAKVATEAGVAVTLEHPDGRRVTLAPVETVANKKPDSEVDNFFAG